MNRVDIDVPIGSEMSRLAIYCWGLFLGAIPVPLHSVTWNIVIHDAIASLSLYWFVRGLGRINRYRKQRRAC